MRSCWPGLSRSPAGFCSGEMHERCAAPVPLPRAGGQAEPPKRTKDGVVAKIRRQASLGGPGCAGWRHFVKKTAGIVGSRSEVAAPAAGARQGLEPRSGGARSRQQLGLEPAGSCQTSSALAEPRGCLVCSCDKHFIYFIFFTGWEKNPRVFPCCLRAGRDARKYSMGERGSGPGAELGHTEMLGCTAPGRGA